MLRRLLIIGTVATLLLCGGAVAFGVWLWDRMALSTADKIEFVNPLAVPPLAESRLDADGRRVFDLTARPGHHDFGAGPVATWGFNGDYLGPTLRAARGEQVVVNVHNELPEVTSVHWHGMHVPAEMDGGPHQPVPPGGSWTATWLVDQPAATLWYHPHPHGATEPHIYRGLAGVFLIDDEATADLPLPREYGVDDFPVVVQDKRFTDDGRLNDRHSLGGAGILGDTVVVNGTLAPYLEVTTQLVRLRLLNGSTARSYDFGFTDDREFALIGTDAGLREQPLRTSRIMLSPGERAEIVVGMRPGERVVLRSTPPDLGGGAMDRMSGGADTLDILQLRAAERLAASPALPEQLVEVPTPDPAGGQAREFQLSNREINGRKMDMSRIDFAAPAGSTEVWRVINKDGVPHNFHAHGVSFQVRSVDGAPPPAYLRGWKDTVYLRPHVTHELVVPLPDYRDPDTPYMYHCHLVAHEDQGMMGQFVLVGPGERAGEVEHAHHHP